MNKNKLAIIFLFSLNIIPVFGLWWGNRPETGLVQYGENIDKEKLELLEDKQIIHFLGQDKNNMVIGTYTIRNNGDEYKTTLGILFQEWGGYPNPEELNLQFFVNNKKVKYYIINNGAAVKMGEKRIDLPQSSTCWTLIDVTFPRNSIVTVKVQHTRIYSSYNSPYMEHFPGLLDWKGPTKFSVEIKNEEKNINNVEEYWISNIAFTSKTLDYNHWWIDLNMNEYLQTLQDMETSLIKLQIKNGNTFLIEFREDFYKNYHRSFMLDWRYWEFGYNYLYIEGENEIYFGMFNDTHLRSSITKRLLGPYELIFLTKKQLQVMRNVFYARHGYIFKTKDMQAMFENGAVNYDRNPNFTESMLTDIDRANIEIIKRLEAFSGN
jgi:hypothetical protein